MADIANEDREPTLFDSLSGEPRTSPAPAEPTPPISAPMPDSAQPMPVFAPPSPAPAAGGPQPAVVPQASAPAVAPPAVPMPAAEPPFAAPPIPARLAAARLAPLRPESRSGAWWTIPLVCIGLCMIACAMILGQVESNRKLAWQREKLQRDYDYLQRQLKVNDKFLSEIQHDPTLAERVAQRQTKEVRAGTAVLSLPSLATQEERNPFLLVTIPPPAPLAPYQPRRSVLVWLCENEHRRLWVTAAGLICVAAGLVLGGSEPRRPCEAMGTRP